MLTYTLQQGNKTVGFNYKNEHFIIGFQKAVLARKVHYNMDPNPKFQILPDDPQRFYKTSLGKTYEITMDTKCTLFIPKFNGSFLDPLNDGCYHLNSTKERDFYTYPFNKNLGIILPYNLIDETPDEFIFKSYMIYPCIDVENFEI